MLTGNKNFLTPQNFKFTINSEKYPNLDYFVTATTMPGVSVSAVEASFRGLSYPFASDSLQYDDLVIQFNIDEDLNNYTETYNWIKSLSNSEQPYSEDAILTIFSSHNNAVKQIKFYDVFPTNITGIEFNSQVTSTDYLQASVTFTYTSYEIL